MLHFIFKKPRVLTSSPFDIIGSLNLKGDLGTIVQTAGNILSTSFDRKKDIEIGQEYINYFDPLWSVLEFQNYGVRLVVGNNSENGARNCPVEILGDFFTGTFIDNRVIFFDKTGKYYGHPGE